MGLFKSVFGPSQDEIWSQIAAEIGGDYIDGGFWGKDKLIYSHDDWEILLDTYTVNSNNSSTTYTRMRAPFINNGSFNFKIYNEGFFSSIGKLFGMQDILIGDSFFDEQFIIKANDEAKVRELLSDSTMKSLIHAQPRIQFYVKDDEGLFGQSFPYNADELYFSACGLIRDKNQLHNLFKLFCTTLNRLVEIDAASTESPSVRLD